MLIYKRTLYFVLASSLPLLFNNCGGFEPAPYAEFGSSLAETVVDSENPGSENPGSENSGSETPGSEVPTTNTKSNICENISKEIYSKNTNQIIEVKPLNNGKVEVNGNTTTLRSVITSAKSGSTILLQDGTYSFNNANSTDNYTGLYFNNSNITLRSKSGDANKVILDSNYSDHGGSSGLVSINAQNVIIADITVQKSIFHLIHMWANASQAHIHNVNLIDGGQQFMKASSNSDIIKNVQVTCSKFIMTSSGRDNVWGYGSGSTSCYTGGIDTHMSANWTVTDNLFKGIYCNGSGVRRPAHNKKPGDRNNNTYIGGLAEHAIHMWESPQGTQGHKIERNHIINCARGIGLGLKDSVYGSSIKNNFIFSEHSNTNEHDVGIIIERAHNVDIINNTILFTHNNAYPNAIEYRYENSSNITIYNNLTNKTIRARNGAMASKSNNIENANSSLFLNPLTGDLHIKSCNSQEVIMKGRSVANLNYDIDGDPRPNSSPDIGADQCTP